MARVVRVRERFYAIMLRLAAPILRDGFSVGEFADSGQQYAGYAGRDAMATARADRVPIVYPRAGMVWRTDTP